MYYIIIDGEVKGMVDYPNYVKQKEGIWINATEKDHEAIAFQSVAYPDALAKKIDGAEIVFAQGVKLDEANERIESNDDALMEIAEYIESNDDAIMEIADIVSNLMEG